MDDSHPEAELPTDGSLPGGGYVSAQVITEALLKKATPYVFAVVSLVIACLALIRTF